jgi:hypothetical protein
MAKPSGDIAVTIAIFSIVSGVSWMHKEQMNSEKMYQVTMSVIRRMREEGLVSADEYRRMDAIFLAKYRPMYGTLSSETY